MDTLLPYLSTVMAGVFAILLFFYYLLRTSSASKGKIPPEAAGGWPLIGHLHLLGGSQLPHKTLGDMADKYGPVFTIRLGMHRTLVVNTWEMAKECFTTNDVAVASRPKLLASKYLGYNYASFGFAPHGAYWREMRKIANLELLSNQRLELLKHVRASETESSVKGLYKLWIEKKNGSGCVLVDMKQWFGDLTLNVILRMVGGKRYSGATIAVSDEKEARRCQKAMRDFFHLLGLFVVADAIPFLGWLDLGGHEKVMKKTAEEIDSIANEWLEEHRRNRASGETHDGEQDFMDVMLSILEGTNLAGYDADTIIKATVMRYSEKKRGAPEAAGAWPVIGHLHLFGGSQLPHKTLAAMADKFGPIFAIKLGVHRTLVVSNWEMAEECFTTNDKALANRPKFVAVELLGYNYAMFGLGPYGPYWRQVRKIAMLEILSNRRLELLGHIRQSEIKTSIKGIYERWVKKNSKSGADKVFVEMKEWFGDVAINVVTKMLVGKRYSSEEEEGVRFKKAIREFFVYLGMFLVSDALPFLRWLDWGGHERAMKRVAKEMDNILETWLQEHKQRRISGVVKGDQDFMDVMLSILPEDLSRYDADTINKATCLALMTGATDTTTVTLTWALSLLLNNRNVLKKAQEELDIHVGKERQVEESDMKNLVYLQAILKETLRLYPAGPLSLPHESMEDCTLGGYHVPKKTRLLVNLWNIHRDSRIWLDPCEFRPERFLTSHKHVDVRGQHFELIPFGSGRRMCPGITFALQVMQFALAGLLHGFDFATLSNEPVDMSESPGLTNLKATPLEVLLTPRLSSNLYG